MRSLASITLKFDYAASFNQHSGSLSFDKLSLNFNAITSDITSFIALTDRLKQEDTTSAAVTTDYSISTYASTSLEPFISLIPKQFYLNIDRFTFGMTETPNDVQRCNVEVAQFSVKYDSFRTFASSDCSKLSSALVKQNISFPFAFFEVGIFLRVLKFLKVSFAPTVYRHKNIISFRETTPADEEPIVVCCSFIKRIVFAYIDAKPLQEV